MCFTLIYVELLSSAHCGEAEPFVCYTEPGGALKFDHNYTLCYYVSAYLDRHHYWNMK